MASLWYLCILLPLILPSWSIVSLYRNYRQAKTSNLPILVVPFDPFNPLWMLCRPYVNPLISRLPFGLGSLSQYNYLGFTGHTKNQLHELHGPAFMLVTPGTNQLFVGDANACDDILKSHREWHTNPAFNAPLNMFGKNIGTAYGKDWQRHRKITNTAFTEPNYGLVWRATIQQTKHMLVQWTKAENGLTSTTDDAGRLTLHVLVEAGLGIRHDFGSALEVVPQGYKTSYHDAIQLLLHNLFISYAVASTATLVPVFLVPRVARRYLDAISDFKRYIADMIKNERLAAANGERAVTQNLLVNVIRAAEGDEKSAFRLQASDGELTGNLFIYNFAGHESTANTITYAIAFLACFPEWQDWMREEIYQVFGDRDPAESDYPTAFSQLQRHLAVMYETLRLFPPLSAIPRYSGPLGYQLRIGFQTYPVPLSTNVFINTAVIQADPRIWGADALEWRPDRWISSETGTLTRPQTDKSFIAWSAGGRSCPGRKFSQVGFVAAMSCLFQRHRVLPVLRDGESTLQARERILKVVADSDTMIAVRMNHPERMTVKWEKCA